MSADRTADRQTDLAVERTELAWWRTGLTALAVAVGVGRVVPELNDGATSWPYAAIGIAFAVYGIALFWHGTNRASEGFARNTILAIAGPLLGVAVIILIAAS